jgi:hypothetical protein
MASTNLNPALRDLSGNLSGYVFRIQADGSTQVAKVPRRDPDRQFSAAQLAHREHFKEAVAYSRHVIQEDPTALALYKHLQVKRGPMSRLRAIIIGDKLKPPTITTVDVSQYHGAVGDVIAIKAEDNMAVARVTATIRDQANAQVIETLEYVPAVDELAETVLCVLKARTAVPAGHSVLVEADAYDLAGNKCQVTQPA